MMPSKEYMENIAKKLDSFNRINGFFPQKDAILKDDFDLMDYMGKTAINHMNGNSQNLGLDLNPDPLFRDHNTY